MDLGIFFSSKRKLIIWIFSPALLLSVFSIPFFIYLKSANAILSEKKFMLNSMPAIIEKITMAQEILKGYKPNSSNSGIIEWLNSQLNQVGKNSGFPIDSLVVKKDDSKTPTKELVTYKVSITGKGGFSAIINFFNKSQASIPLLSLENVKLRIIGKTSENIYEAQISFAYNNLT